MLAVNFAQGSEAYEAMSVMNELDNQGQVKLVGAAVVVRDDAGQVEVKDEVGDAGFEGTAARVAGGVMA